MGVTIGRKVGEVEEDGQTLTELDDHDRVDFSYSGFSALRTQLAAAYGIELDEMRGFKRGGGGRSWDGVDCRLAPLLNHSDCDGTLTPAEARQVWPALQDAAQTAFDDPHDRRSVLALARVLRNSADNEQTVVFR